MQYPLLLSFSENVLGVGFSASVKVHGRALGEFEDGLYWLTGVYPAGMAREGATLRAAADNFRKTFGLMLEDISAEVTNFAAFQAAVERLVANVDLELSHQWEAARLAMRRAANVPEGLATMRLVQQPSVVVEELPAAPVEALRMTEELRQALLAHQEAEAEEANEPDWALAS